MATESEHQGRCTLLDRVQDLLDGRLSPDFEPEFRQHLQRCPACQAELESLRQTQAALRQAALAPLPAIDRAALERGLFDRPRAEPAASILGRRPVLASATAAVAFLAVTAWMILAAFRSETPGPAPGAVQPPPAEAAAWPISAPAEPTRITYQTGQVSGPQAGVQGWQLALDQPVRVGPGGGLALRLDPDTSLAVMGDSRIRVDWDAGWEVRLEAGALAARLGKGRPHRFRVHCQAGLVEALGTSFSLTQLTDGEFELVLAEGALLLTTPDGRIAQVLAPAQGRFSQTGFDPQAARAEGDQPLDLAAQFDPGEQGPLGSLYLSSQPQPAQVLLAGRELGSTPLYIARPAGELDLTVRAAGHEPLRLALEVAPDRLIEHRAELRPSPGEPASALSDPLAAARTLLAARRLDEARALIERHLRAQPDDTRGWVLLADGQRLGGRAADALDTYLKAARLAEDARLAEAAVYQAGLLRLHSLGKPAAALATFETLRREHPQGLLRQEVAFHLAECYLANGDYPRALRALEDYLRVYPQGTNAAAARTLLDRLEAKGWK